MASGTIEFWHESSETGFDGKYEKDIYHRLIGNPDGTITVEVETVKRTSGEADSTTRRSVRHTIDAKDLKSFVESSGKTTR